ncbi:hypothetical protein [Amycolatopsis magusensis]|uniref:hypothetical protein n=1 Tax=Amycolatopsis magusensis TaxID=882444 RepID=UPI0037BC55C4
MDARTVAITIGIVVLLAALVLGVVQRRRFTSKRVVLYCLLALVAAALFVMLALMFA